MDYELLGANIRKYRVNLGMKQEELAEKSGKGRMLQYAHRHGRECQF